MFGLCARCGGGGIQIELDVDRLVLVVEDLCSQAHHDVPLLLLRQLPGLDHRLVVRDAAVDLLAGRRPLRGRHDQIGRAHV